MNRLKKILYFIKNKYRKLILKKKNIYISKGVRFTDKTKFENNIKIYQYTHIANSEIGLGTYIGWNSIFNNCIIGRFCSIAPYSQIIYGTHPVSGFISSHPAFFSKSKQAGFSFTDENLFVENNYVIPARNISVIIGNDVWIGLGASIMEGVSIGDGAIIAAGAIVTKDVQAYSIVGGIPAKVIRYRFSQLEIEKLMNFKWWERDFNWIKRNHKYFCNIDNLDDFIKNKTS